MDFHIRVRQRFSEARVIEQNGNGLQRRPAVDGTGGVGENSLLIHRHIPVLESNEVAAKRRIPRFHGDACGGGFHRRPAGKAFLGVAAEDGEDRGFAARRQRRRAVHDAAHDAFGSQAVDGGN